MPLKIGTWKANVNGTEIDLVIDSVGNDGRLIGTIFNGPISGFWDEVAQSISFTTTFQDASAPGERLEVRFYRGYRFASPANQPGQDVTWTIAGYCEGNDLSFNLAVEPSARRNIFGWFAQIKEVV